MRLRRSHFRTLLVDDCETVTLDDQRISTAAITLTEHPGVDLDDIPVKALQDAPALRRRVTDDDSLGTDHVQY